MFVVECKRCPNHFSQRSAVNGKYKREAHRRCGPSQLHGMAIMVGTTEQFLSFYARSHSGTPTLSYYVLDLISQLFYTIVACYLCHRIAPTQKTALGGVIGIGLVVGSVSLVTSWNREPRCYGSGLLASYAPCVWIGWALRNLVVRPTGRKSQIRWRTG